MQRIEREKKKVDKFLFLCFFANYIGWIFNMLSLKNWLAVIINNTFHSYLRFYKSKEFFSAKSHPVILLLPVNRLCIFNELFPKWDYYGIVLWKSLAFNCCKLLTEIMHYSFYQRMLQIYKPRFLKRRHQPQRKDESKLPNLHIKEL